MNVGLRRDDSLHQSTWIVVLVLLPLGLGESAHPKLLVIFPDFKQWFNVCKIETTFYNLVISPTI